MLSDSCAMSLLQEASDYRRQSLVTEACRRSETHIYTNHKQGDLWQLLERCCNLFSLCNSLENLDRKFDKMLCLQVLDKSKAIAQILQEVGWVEIKPPLCLKLLDSVTHLGDLPWMVVFAGGDAEGSIPGAAAPKRRRSWVHP